MQRETFIFFIFYFFLFVVNSVIHWNEKALGSHVFFKGTALFGKNQSNKHQRKFRWESTCYDKRRPDSFPIFQEQQFQFSGKSPGQGLTWERSLLSTCLITHTLLKNVRPHSFPTYAKVWGVWRCESKGRRESNHFISIKNQTSEVWPWTRHCVTYFS